MEFAHAPVSASAITGIWGMAVQICVVHNGCGIGCKSSLQFKTHVW